MLIRVTTISNACTPDITAKGVNTNASKRYVTIKNTAGEVLCLKFDNLLDVIVTSINIFNYYASSHILTSSLSPVLNNQPYLPA